MGKCLKCSRSDTLVCCASCSGRLEAWLKAVKKYENQGLSQKDAVKLVPFDLSYIRRSHITELTRARMLDKCRWCGSDIGNAGACSDCDQKRLWGGYDRLIFLAPQPGCGGTVAAVLILSLFTALWAAW